MFPTSNLQLRSYYVVFDLANGHLGGSDQTVLYLSEAVFVRAYLDAVCAGDPPIFRTGGERLI